MALGTKLEGQTWTFQKHMIYKDHPNKYGTKNKQTPFCLYAKLCRIRNISAATMVLTAEKGGTEWILK